MEVMGDCRAVTVCDRECDIYDFFKFSNELDAPVLVRATSDRTINRKSRYAEKGVIKLWGYMMTRPSAGSLLCFRCRKAILSAFLWNSVLPACIQVA